MNKKPSNLFFKVLKLIQKYGVLNLKTITKEIQISEEMVLSIIESLEKLGYLNHINEGDYNMDKLLACKFCPFANECGKSERLQSRFYELSQKGKISIDNYHMDE